MGPDRLSKAIQFISGEMKRQKIDLDNGWLESANVVAEELRQRSMAFRKDISGIVDNLNGIQERGNEVDARVIGLFEVNPQLGE